MLRLILALLLLLLPTCAEATVVSTVLDSGHFGDGGADVTRTSNSMTPVSGQLVLIWVTQSTGNASKISTGTNGFNITWTTHLANGQISLFRGVASSGTAGTISYTNRDAGFSLGKTNYVVVTYSGVRTPTDSQGVYDAISGTGSAGSPTCPDIIMNPYPTAQYAIAVGMVQTTTNTTFSASTNFTGQATIASVDGTFGYQFKSTVQNIPFSLNSCVFGSSVPNANMIGIGAILETSEVSGILFFAGGETGDTSEFSNVSANFVSTATCSLLTTANCTTAGAATSGNYCYCVNVGSSQARTRGGHGSQTSFNTYTGFARMRFVVAATPGGSNTVFAFSDSGGTHFINIGMNTSRQLFWGYDNLTPIATGTTALTAGTWYKLDIKAVVDASVGGVELKINDVTEFTSLGSNTSTMSTGGIQHLRIGPSAAQNVSFRYDDIMFCVGGYCPPGRTIARQGASGTPTYTAWTLNSCTSSLVENCWSQTPFNVTPNATSSTAAAAQTMLVSTFASTQSGHGSETVGNASTINACKTNGVIKSGTLNAPLAIRTRLSGTDTDLYRAIATLDTLYDDGIWTTTAAVLRGATMEAGVVHGTGAAADQVEDVWMQCDYLDATLSPRQVYQD